MDISGLSDPFCVVLWNGVEVGRTATRYGTVDPDWVGDDGLGAITCDGISDAGGWYELPFFVPETETWGEEAWPSMRLEVRGVIRQGLLSAGGTPNNAYLNRRPYVHRIT